MISVNPGLYVVVEQLESQLAPLPRPLDHGFSQATAYLVLGAFSLAESADAFFILSNDKDEIWFISNRHLRTYRVIPDALDFRIPKASANGRPAPMGQTGNLAAHQAKGIIQIARESRSNGKPQLRKRLGTNQKKDMAQQDHKPARVAASKATPVKKALCAKARMVAVGVAAGGGQRKGGQSGQRGSRQTDHGDGRGRKENRGRSERVSRR